MSFIGNISLNISFIIYLLWFMPQVWLNFKRKDTEGLSMLMHGILCIGYLCDLIYGFGRDMQWQYRTVTIVGLISLAVQHYQIGRYGLHRRSEKLTYLALNIIYSVLFITSIYVINFSHFDKQILDLMGMCANACWLSYVIPQIIKNYNNQSTLGLSAIFVCFSIFLNVCDTTSAWMLGWDYPSKIGPTLSLIQNFILLWQVKYYAKQHNRIGALVVNR
jgi:uncharacterized protein with PQ loop repeat